MTDEQHDDAQAEHEREQSHEARQKQRAREWAELERWGWDVSESGRGPCALSCAGYGYGIFDTRDKAIDYALQLAALATEK